MQVTVFEVGYFLLERGKAIAGSGRGLTTVLSEGCHDLIEFSFHLSYFFIIIFLILFLVVYIFILIILILFILIVLIIILSILLLLALELLLIV